MKIALSTFATTLLASMALLVWTPTRPTAAQIAAPGLPGRAPAPPQAANLPSTSAFHWGSARLADPLAGDPEAVKLREEEVAAAQEAHSLTTKFQQTSAEDDRMELREQLREALVRQFDAQQARRALEIERIEQRLATYKEKVEKRNAAKDMIIDRRLDQLTGVGDDLGWEETGVGPHPGRPIWYQGPQDPVLSPFQESAPAVAPPAVAPPPTAAPATVPVPAGLPVPPAAVGPTAFPSTEW